MFTSPIHFIKWLFSHKPSIQSSALSNSSMHQRIWYQSRFSLEGLPPNWCNTNLLRFLWHQKLKRLRLQMNFLGLKYAIPLKLGCALLSKRIVFEETWVAQRRTNGVFGKISVSFWKFLVLLPHPPSLSVCLSVCQSVPLSLFSAGLLIAPSHLLSWES